MKSRTLCDSTTRRTPQATALTSRGAQATASAAGALSAGGQQPSSGPQRARARPPSAAAHRPAQSQGTSVLQASVGSREVANFLKECGLQMYTVQLLQNGFDEMETLHAIGEVDAKELGIPPYHAARLQRNLRELRHEDDAEESGPNPVAIFLEEHGLGQYASALLESGFDEMETLLEIEDSDLKDLSVPRGHALKLKRHLREYLLDVYATEEPPTTQWQSPVQPGQGNSAPVPPRSSGTVSVVVPAAVPLATCAPFLPEKMKGDVERSWEKLQELGTSVVGEYVYRFFFEVAPESMNLFPVHVRLKYREWTSDEGEEEEGDLMSSSALKKLFSKVLNAIGCAVAGLQDAQKLVPLLTTLGARHIGYGVSEALWQPLGTALIRTLREILQDEFTPEVEKAWTIVYGFMSSIMMEGLRKAKEAERKSGFRADDTMSQSSQGTRLAVSVNSADAKIQQTPGDEELACAASDSTMSTKSLE